MSIYWRYNELLDKQERLLEGWKGSPVNKALIRRFQTHLLAKGASQAHIAKHMWGMRKLCDVLQKDLDSVTKLDLERLIAVFQSKTFTTYKKQPFSEATKGHLKGLLKQFYRWYEEEDPRLEMGDETVRKDTQRFYKYLFKHISRAVKPSPVDPGAVLSDEDIQKVLAHCRYDHERAAISILHETGVRIGELLSIRLKDIQLGEPLWALRVTGKTGERRVFVRKSIPYIARLLDTHRDKKNPDAPLFLCENNRYTGKPLRYAGVRKMLRVAFERVGLGKKNNPHWFRHSRATLDASVLTDSIANKKMGWTEGSQQMKRYRHVSAQQLEQAEMQRLGLTKAIEAQPTPLPIRCICGALNEPDRKYCYSCLKALSVEIAYKEQDYLQKAFDIFGKIMADPKLRAEFEEFKERRKTQ